MYEGDELEHPRTQERLHEVRRGEDEGWQMGIDCTQPLSNSTEANGSQPETNVSHHEGDCKTRVSSRDTNLSLSSHYPVSQSSSLWGDKQENETFFVVVTFLIFTSRRP